MILLGGAISASILTQVFDFTVPRFNNVFTAAWLIYVGMQTVQRFKVGFDSWFLFMLSLACFYSFAVLRGDVHLNKNIFDDIVSLTASTLAALYVVCFISKKCKGWFAKVMAWIGKDSFYIMGLHFFTFKVGTVVLNWFGWANLNPADLMAPAQNLALYIYYSFVGIFMPLALIYAWRTMKSFVLNIIIRK